jgi:hypothetical protein
MFASARTAECFTSDTVPNLGTTACSLELLTQNAGRGDLAKPKTVKKFKCFALLATFLPAQDVTNQSTLELILTEELTGALKQ